MIRNFNAVLRYNKTIVEYIIAAIVIFGAAAVAYAYTEGKKQGWRKLDKEYRHTLLTLIYGEELDKKWQDSLIGYPEQREKLLIKNSYDYSPIGANHNLQGDQYELLERVLYEAATDKKFQNEIIKGYKQK